MKSPCRPIRALLFLFLAAAVAVPARAADAGKTLRYALEVAEKTLDPHRVSDLYSNILNSGIFDTPLKYDYLARPLRLKPNTLVDLPEVSADGLTYTMRVKPGIYFDDDPAFGGRKRELVAEDYVYSMKRLMDPALAAPMLSQVEGIIVGSDEALARARRANRFDYDAPIEGLRALDRYTWQIKLTQPFGVFVYDLTDCRVSCAVAREVVERYGADVGSHPVGTGPYRLAFWKRSSKLVFEPNPNYREEYFDGEPVPGDAEAERILALQKGKRLPMIGRIEVSIIEAQQPRWLSFLTGEMDLIFRIGEEFAYIAIPNNTLAPNLAKRGIGMAQVHGMDLTFNYFNMEDPVFGGYTPEKVALRRAICLAYKTADEVAIIRKGQAIPAETPYSPGVAGWTPGFRTSAGEYSVPKAKALLDMYGYVDRDGDGYREQPDGSPLVLHFNSTPTERDKQLDELWKRSMDDIGIRFTVRKAQWQELLKEGDAGKLQFWQLGSSASAPDADTWLISLYGPNSGQKGNIARFRLEAFDRLYEKARIMRDSPERTRLYQEMARLVAAYAPWKINTHRILTDLWYPWVVGYRRPLVQSQNWWRYVDIDNSRK
ncbi:MAG TPA: ABC transporter substrate-binding protein [Usitatibacter sp.]|nr:ABC transporter substrate-binding protein [Usitatibacter sp.]